MSDYKPLLASLTQQLVAKLAFRQTELTSTLQETNAHGPIGIVFAKVYESEAQIRADLVANILRQSRPSWSPSQIVDAKYELKTTVCDLFKANLSEAAKLSENISTITRRRHDQQPENLEIIQSFLRHTDQASKAALAMVEAVINEIVAAASNEMTAEKSSDRPTYIIHGPVGSITHGNATVGSVHQTVGTATPQELANAVSALLQTLNDRPEFVNAKTELQEAETELRKDRVPFAGLMRTLNIFGKIEDIAIKAPEVADHLARLSSMLGLT